MRRRPAELAEEIAARLPDLDGSVVVALDGRSGSGKSTVAEALRRLLSPTRAVTVVEGDTFYGGGSASTWDGRSAAENVDCAFDWRRQRAVIETLRRGDVAKWQSFDWVAPIWDSDDPPFEDELQSAAPADVVVLEGVYSARPENSDVIDMRVLIDISEDARHLQLKEREGAAMKHDWESRWSRAEDHYFARVMPPQGFDVIIRPEAEGHA